MLSVSVIVPAYQDIARLQLTINALREQTFKQDDFEIIIVDNDPGTRGELFIELPVNARIIFEENPGSYSARNTGLKHARGKFIAFTDSDCIPEPDWICNAISLFQENKDIDRISGCINIFREVGSSWIVWKYESITAFNQKYNISQGAAVTANLFVKKSVFEKVGFFNEYLMSGGDIEWNQRATQQGITIVYAENVIVNHPARPSISSLIKKSRRVIGGTLARAKESKETFRFVLWLFIPPIRYARVLITSGCKPSEVIFSVVIFWLIKLTMIFETIRICFGGRPLR